MDKTTSPIVLVNLAGLTQKILLIIPALGLLLTTPPIPVDASNVTIASPSPTSQAIPDPPPLHAPWPAGNEWNTFPGSSFHTGKDAEAVDFNGPGTGNADEGAIVLAVADGMVVKAETGTGCPNTYPVKASYGCEVVIGHANGYETRYAHLKDVFVTKGQKVAQGTPVGLLGKSGNAEYAHLHFVVYYCALDPLDPKYPRPSQPCPDDSLKPIRPKLWDAKTNSLVEVPGNVKTNFTSSNYGVGYEEIKNVFDTTQIVKHQPFLDIYDRLGGQSWVFGQTSTPVRPWAGSETLYQEFGPQILPGLPWSGLGSALVESQDKGYFVLGPIWGAYKDDGGPSGKWGNPVSHTYEWRLPAAQAYRSDFANGSIIWLGGNSFEYLDERNAPWVGRFFDQPNQFSGAGVQRRDKYLDFYWPADAAPGPVIAFDGFSATWEITERGFVSLSRIIAPEVQGHLQVTVNGKVALEADSPDQALAFQSSLQLGVGDQHIVVKFWQEGRKDARLHLTTAGIGPVAFASDGPIASGLPPAPSVEFASYEPPSFPGSPVSPPIPVAASTSTVLVFDTSGSMAEPVSSGKTKLEAAQAAGASILDIITAENQAQGATTGQVGIVDFNNFARADTPLSTDVSGAQGALQGFVADGGTGMPDGLKAAVDLLSADTSGAKPIIILLSDGLPNIGLGGDGSLDANAVKQQVLDLATQAGKKGQCIYTVGFGIPLTVGTVSGDASIDEDFLKQVSANSGCGTYYNAQNAAELANVYVQLRHSSTGTVLLQQSGQIAQGQQVDIGSVPVPANQSQILFTLNWPGSRLNPILTDPTGRAVDTNYPGASISSAATIATIVVANPLVGRWQVAAQGIDVPEGVTTYLAILSSRPSSTATRPPSPRFPAALVVLLLAAGVVATYVLARTGPSAARNRRYPASTANAWLIGVGGEAVGRSIAVNPAGLAIGRGRLNHLRLGDLQVSRRHANIRYAAGRWYLQDQGSKTGTFVNGQRVAATVLNDGDRIRIGLTEFEFRLR